MGMDNLKFGEYIAKIRISQGISLKYVAENLAISSVYLSDIEKDRRHPPSKTLLEKISILLNMSEEDKGRMYDLAGHERGIVSNDLTDYIMSNDKVRETLRLAIRMATDADWERFAKLLKEKDDK